MDALSQTREARGSTLDRVAEALRQTRIRGMRDSTSFRNPAWDGGVRPATGGHSSHGRGADTP